jgi:hypothetical protein
MVKRYLKKFSKFQTDSIYSGTQLMQSVFFFSQKIGDLDTLVYNTRTFVGTSILPSLFRSTQSQILKFFFIGDNQF